MDHGSHTDRASAGSSDHLAGPPGCLPHHRQNDSATDEAVELRREEPRDLASADQETKLHVAVKGVAGQVGARDESEQVVIDKGLAVSTGGLFLLAERHRASRRWEQWRSPSSRSCTGRAATSGYCRRGGAGRPRS